MMEKFNINRYGDVVTIDVELKYATELADFLDERNVSISEVRLQHQTAIGIIITAPTDNVESFVERVESVCVWYFTNKVIKKAFFAD